MQISSSDVLLCFYGYKRVQCFLDKYMVFVLYRGIGKESESIASGLESISSCLKGTPAKYRGALLRSKRIFKVVFPVISSCK